MTVALLLLLFCPIAASQSLRETAKRGLPATAVVSIDVPEASFDEVISRSELVLHGTILDVAARFTPDESLIFTEYTISPIRIFKQQRPLSTATAPGQSTPIIVRHLGGIITEGEQRFSTSADLYPPAEHFQRGDQVVLFLVHNDATQAYNLTYGPFGAFRVVKGHAIPMTNKVAQRRGDVPRPLAQFLGELEQRTRREK